MLNLKKFSFFLALFCLNMAYGSELPPEVAVYLKTKEVPKELKKKLDQIFLSPNVIEGIDLIYAENSFTEKEGIKVMQREGFCFLKHNIFRHKSLPNLIFKISDNGFLRTEMLNASRIRYSELLNGKANNVIRTPTKYAYMPYVYRNTNDHIALPICIIVAEFVEQKRNEVVYLDDKRKKLLRENGYTDDHDGNILNFKDYVLVIDTEDHSGEITYPPIKSKL